MSYRDDSALGVPQCWERIDHDQRPQLGVRAACSPSRVPSLIRSARMPRTGDLGYELLQPPYTPPMMTLRSTVAGAVLLAAVSSCSSVSTASAPAVSQTSATTMSPSSSTENQGTPASSSLPTPSSSAALESPAESGAPDTSSSDDPRDAIFTKTLRDKGRRPSPMLT